MLKNFILGMFTATADLVPGISGGTIMMISGKYYDIIRYVNQMMRFKFTKESSKFIFPILVGWLVGILAFVRLINYLMLSYKVEMYGLFSGLIVGGVFYILKDIKKEKKISIFIVGISFAISLLIFLLLKNTRHLSANFSWWYLFLSAFVASVVMPLPGISGSTMFLIFGIYSPIINSLSHAKINILLPVMLGMIIGWFSTVKVLNTLFEKYKITLLEILLGITLAGAVKIFPLTLSFYPYIFAVVGLILSFGVESYFAK